MLSSETDSLGGFPCFPASVSHTLFFLLLHRMHQGPQPSHAPWPGFTMHSPNPNQMPACARLCQFGGHGLQTTDPTSWNPASPLP